MKILRVVACCCLLLAINAGAQVPNDVCANASVFYMPTGGCSVWDGSQGLFWFGDSISTAIANFPYPANPNPCTGYTSTVAAPANDRWYVLPNNGPAQIRLNLECSDTCHVSWWRGVCGMLQPMQCYTLVPNLEQAMEPFTASTVTDTFYMQISGNGLPGNFAYRACLRLSPTVGDPIPVSDPTPVICFTYDTEVGPASSEDDIDGSIIVTMTQGTPPYSILWTDGDTTFERTGLAAGQYVATLTDAQGCAEQLIAEVGVDVVTGVPDIQREPPRAIVADRDQGMLLIPLPIGWEMGELRLFTMGGELIKTRQLTTQGHLDVSGLYPGTYILCSRMGDAPLSAVRLIIL